MRFNHLIILLVGLAAAFLPRVAHAQCYEFACDSYGVYDPGSNEITGYSRTVDYWWGNWMLGAVSSVQNAYGRTMTSNSAEGYWEAEADVSWAPDANGMYSIYGTHWYWLEDNYLCDGETYYSLDVSLPPQINSVSASGPWNAGQAVAVTVYGLGFLEYPPWACQGADSDTISPAGDTQATGQVQVSQSATSVTICAGMASYGPITVTPSGGGDPTPSITSVTSDPSPPWQAGSTYPFWVDGTGFGTNPNVTISQNGATYFNGSCGGSQCDTHFAGWVTIPSDAPDGYATVTVTSNGYNGLGFAEPPGNPSEPAWNSTQVQVVGGAPPQPTTAMRLQSQGTVISTDGNYSEDTTIRITAVDAATGDTIQTFVGTVNLAEDGTNIYSQNGGTMPESVQISSGGTATFVVKSLADPGVHGQSPPDRALIKSTNYPVYGGSSLAVPQWIISGTRIDPHSSGDVYDWFQSRAKDIFASATGDVQTILSAVSYYTVGAIATGGVTYWQRASQSPIALNPYYRVSRLGTAQAGACGFSYGSWFRGALLHEARHAYQASQAALSGNDVDGDFLVNTISVAPTNIFLDTTTPRTVCNQAGNVTLTLGYHGDNQFDQQGSPDFAGYAWEQDAFVFSSGN